MANRFRGGLLAIVFGSFAALVFVAGCGRPEREAAGTETLVVFAAASLRDAFTPLAAQFEQGHPGVNVVLNFAGTQELRAQLEHGALAHVFASADQRHMNALLKSGRVLKPTVFARNEPVLVVSTEAAGVVRSLAELPSAERIVLGDPGVPIGAYSLQILEQARVTLGQDFRARVEAKVVSRELNVRQVLTKVSLGEAQAGIVYRTDALSAQGRVITLPIPAELNVTAEYPIALVDIEPKPTSAAAFVRWVLSPQGQSVLVEAGFKGSNLGASR